MVKMLYEGPPLIVGVLSYFLFGFSMKLKRWFFISIGLFGVSLVIFLPLIQKNAAMFESKKLYDNQVADWISNYLKSKDFTINQRAAALLNEYLGTSLSKVTNELDKLIINLPAKSEITQEHIQTNIGKDLPISQVRYFNFDECGRFGAYFIQSFGG